MSTESLHALSYGSSDTGVAFLVNLRIHDGAAVETSNTFGTRLASAMSKASPPFSMKQASSTTKRVGCSDRITLGSLPGRAISRPPSLSSSLS